MRDLLYVLLTSLGCVLGNLSVAKAFIIPQTWRGPLLQRSRSCCHRIGWSISENQGFLHLDHSLAHKRSMHLFSSTKASDVAPPPLEVPKRKLSSVDLHSVTISFEQERGGGSNSNVKAPPVIVLHGMLGQSRNFATWAKNLSRSLSCQRKIFIVDQRNHGNSGHSDGMRYTDMVDDLLEFYEQQGIDEAILVGHSMGGKTAMALALLHPQKVAGLVVMDIAPVPYGPFDGSNWRENVQIIEALQKLEVEKYSSKGEMDTALENDIVNPALRAFALTNVEYSNEDKKFRWKINIQAIGKSLGNIAGFDLGRGNRGLDGLTFEKDVLFMGGSKSRYIRSLHLKQISELFPSFAIQTVKEAGHWVHADRPDETVAMIRNCIER